MPSNNVNVPATNSDNTNVSNADAKVPDVKFVTPDSNNKVPTAIANVSNVDAKLPDVKFVGSANNVNVSNDNSSDKNKKENTKLIIKIVLGILGMLFIIWLIIKIVLLSMYNKIIDYDGFIKGINNQSTYTYASEFITEDYLEYEGIRFRNYIDDSFVKSEVDNVNNEKAIKYVSENYNSSLIIGKDYTYMKMYESSFDYFSDGDDMWNFFTSEKFRKKYMKKNNIDSDYDFFSLVKEVDETKVSIFTPINKLRRMGSLKLFASVAFPSVDEVVVLAGEYNGYVFINKSYREINIETGDERYFISLYGDYFSEDMYLDILNTIVVE